MHMNKLILHIGINFVKILVFHKKNFAINEFLHNLHYLNNLSE